MKLQEIYDLAVKLGIEHDPRGKKEVEKVLKKAKTTWKDLKDDDKKEFDQETLTNPYSDTRVLYGDMNADIKTVMVGIDIETGEMLLADRMKEKGKAVDLVIAHHPEGKALAALHGVMDMQADILETFGVPISVAEGMLASRISEVKRGLLPLNHNKAVDAARMLDIPLMCCHTPSDNIVTDFLQKLLDKQKPETVGDVLTALKKIPEYGEAVKNNAGPTIVTGSKERKTGKIFVDMTGGTGGSEDAFSKLAQAGVGTIVGMHIGEKHRKEAEKNHINVVIAGHISSDSLGMNLFVDELVKQGIEVIPCSGFIRHQRG